MKVYLKIKNNQIIKSLFILASGTGVAQIIQIMVAPILTRLYLPHDFGEYALYYSIFTVLSGLVMLDYQNVIIIEKDNIKAKTALILCTMISLVICMVLLVVGLTIRILNIEILSVRFVTYLLVLPFTLFLNSLNSQLYIWFLRNDELNFISKNKVLLSITASMVQLLMGVLQIGTLGLIFSNFISLVIANFFFFKKFFKNNSLSMFKGQESISGNIKSLAIEYKNLPLLSLWGNMLNIFTLQIPDIFIGKYMGVNFLGQYSLANRTISIPLSFISNSIQEVYRKSASKEINDSDGIVKTYKAIFWITLTIGIVLLVLFNLFVPNIFQIFFGEKWKLAGTIVKIMSVLFVVRLIVSPLSYTFYLLKKQKIDFLWQIGLFVVTISVLYCSRIFNIMPEMKVLEFYVLLTSFWYLINLLLTSKLAKIL